MKKIKFYFSMICLLSVFAFVATSCGDDEEKGLQQFTVTFDSQGGSSVESQTVAEGDKVKEPVAPTKEDAAFLGWFKEAACTTRWDFNRDVVTKDLTLYAGWRTADYTVTFETNGGSAIEPQGVVKGGLVTKPVTPVKEGAAFDGWYADTELTQPYDFDTPVNGDLTLYAKWTEISKEALQQLLADAEELSSDDYEEESYRALEKKMDEARRVIADENATPEEIVTAYQELAEAMKNLVELPHRPTVEIQIKPVPDEEGIISVTPGNWVNLYAVGVDKDGNQATQSEVIFEHQLDAWANPSYPLEVGNHSIDFLLKEDIASGSTTEVTIKSAEDPSLMRTVTLKVVTEDDLVQQFIEAAAALPDASTITIDNYPDIYKLILRAEDLYDRCSGLPSAQGPDFEAAFKKLDACWEVTDNFWYFSYSFDGNRCKLVEVVYDEIMNCDYQADGAFPAGVYTADWEKYSETTYGQTRLILKEDGTCYSEYREASTPDGSAAGVWEKEMDGTYKYTGSKEQGGNILLEASNYYDDYAANATVRSMKAFKSKVLKRR